jgi:hypothetical protein
MKSLFTLSLAFAVAACLTATSSFAQETAVSPKVMAEKLDSGSTAKTCCSEKESCDGECPISAAMASLPKMSYKIGEESTCCAHSAQSLAEKHNAPIHYVVAETAYTDKSEAMTALVEKTEAALAAYTTPSVCEKSGTTTIAGEKCSCPMKAASHTKLVQEAVKAVSLSYVVGEETCNCPMKAKELAAGGAEMKYVVGDEETCCEMTARLNVARAKYKAAVEALTKAQASAGETAPASNS